MLRPICRRSEGLATSRGAYLDGAKLILAQDGCLREKLTQENDEIWRECEVRSYYW